MKYQFRLFFSSTFYDMKNERKYFQDIIYPEITEFCKQRNVDFFPIDLRWGVKDDMRLVLKTCFNEIDNSRPFFIGTIGYRYGTLPNQAEIDAVRDILRAKHPDMPSTIIVEGESVTEMEIDYGLMNAPDFSAVFFMRDKENSIETGRDEKKKELYAKQEALRRKLEQSIYTTYPYANIEDYGILLKQAIIRFIESRYSGDDKNDFFTFSQEQIKNRIANTLYLPEVHKRINNWYASNTPVLFCVKDHRGESGWTTFLCQFLNNRQKQGNTVLYIDASTLYSQDNQYQFISSYILQHITTEARNPIVFIDSINLLRIIDQRELGYFINQHSKYIRFIITEESGNYLDSQPTILWFSCPFEKWEELYTKEQIFTIAKHYLKHNYGKELPERFWQFLYDIDKYYLKIGVDPQLGNLLLVLDMVQGFDADGIYDIIANGYRNTTSYKDMTYWLMDITYKKAEKYNILHEVQQIMLLLVEIELPSQEYNLSGFTDTEIINITGMDSTKWAIARPLILPCCRKLEGYRLAPKWIGCNGFDEAVGGYDERDIYANLINEYIVKNHIPKKVVEEKIYRSQDPASLTNNPHYDEMIKMAHIVIDEAILNLPKDKKIWVIKYLKRRKKKYSDGYHQMLFPLIPERKWSDNKILETYLALYDWALMDKSVAFHHWFIMETAIAIIYKRKGEEKLANIHAERADALKGGGWKTGLIHESLADNPMISNVIALCK